jgi:hypothetical protein
MTGSARDDRPPRTPAAALTRRGVGTVWLICGIAGLVLNAALFVAAFFAVRLDIPFFTPGFMDLAERILLRGVGSVVILGAGVVWFYTRLIRTGLGLRSGVRADAGFLWPVLVVALLSLIWNGMPFVALARDNPTRWDQPPGILFLVGGLLTLNLVVVDVLLLASGIALWRTRGQTGVPVPPRDPWDVTSRPLRWVGTVWIVCGVLAVVLNMVELTLIGVEEAQSIFLSVVRSLAGYVVGNSSTQIIPTFVLYAALILAGVGVRLGSKSVPRRFPSCVLVLAGGLLAWNILGFLWFGTDGIKGLLFLPARQDYLYLGNAVVSLCLAIVHVLLIVSSAVLISGSAPRADELAAPIPDPVVDSIPRAPRSTEDPSTPDPTREGIRTLPSREPVRTATVPEPRSSLHAVGTVWFVCGIAGLALNVVLLILVLAAFGERVRPFGVDWADWAGAAIHPSGSAAVLVGLSVWFYARMIRAGAVVRAGAVAGIWWPARRLAYLAWVLLVWNALDSLVFWAAWFEMQRVAATLAALCYAGGVLASLSLVVVDAMLLLASAIVVRSTEARR